MQQYDHTNEQERCFFDTVKDLDKVNKQLAKLIVRKEQLTEQIIGLLEHEHEGHKTYEYGAWKIEVKTPFVYSLNKKLYEEKVSAIPFEFNPIKSSVSYTIDKRLCDRYIEEAPKKVRDVLTQLIEKKPGKAAVLIRERT